MAKLAISPSYFSSGEAASTSSESDLLKDQFDLTSFPCAAAQYPFLGSSANLNLQQEVAGNSSYVDVEFMDHVIMAVSRGKRPLPMTHQISPNYSSNMLADFSEKDQRLQLLKSRFSNLN
ncbi:uncharacterized protein LOC131248782 [Magnolia sinica]|uniref:uncharacterized protein LOC131248782 n=1 Tax=Magnolia sinica TaxID=86752 RepID=UPI0026582913|nr:uncharacterized protein LOC131248782 [Magnolia sinica]